MKDNNKKETPEVLKGYVATPEQIAAWKSQYGEDNVKRLPVGDKACYLRKPTRTDLAMVDEMGSNRISDHELLLNELWLAGDQEIKDQDEYFLSTMKPLRTWLKLKDAELKNV